jgi:UDP:flavonoid glycosyltransferase YjiC (YdhE family)
MNVILASLGTDGDVFPYVGLGAKMRSRGHDVTLLASANYQHLATAHGFEFHPLVSTAELHELVQHPDFWNPLKTAPLSARWGVRFLRRQYELMARVARRDDVLVANPGVLAASLIHEQHGHPWVSLVLQPWMVPSSVAPPRMPGLTLLHRAPRPVWKAIWRGLDLVGDVLVGRDLNQLRVSIGLKPTRRIFKNWLSPQRIIGLFPDWYGPPPTDWPEQIRLVGFPLFDGRQQTSLSREVSEFCGAGSPPVAFTFGTGMRHSAALFRAACEATERCGLRALFLTRHQDQLPDRLPPSILHCEFAPFQDLFPRCAAVLHHGGIGTVAAALAAGVPQLIRPLCFDQIDNGARVARLGAGDWIHPARSGPRHIAEALQKLAKTEVRNRCRLLAERCSPNGALEAAAKLIEDLPPCR